MTHTPRTLTAQLPAAVATIELPPCECSACAMERVTTRPDTDSVRGGEVEHDVCQCNDCADRRVDEWMAAKATAHPKRSVPVPVRGSQYARPLDATLAVQPPPLHGPGRVAGGGWVAGRRGRRP